MAQRDEGSLVNDSSRKKNEGAITAGNNQRNLKYNEEDGFMRGARIAEKIQEFYHTSGGPVTGVPGPG
jgi:hypothetical protein